MLERTRTPLIAAGVLMGAGLGGLVDGIILHQILQWHNMLSAVSPPDDLINAKINMAWDGYFHAGVWIMTAIGLAMLWGAGSRREVPWSGQTFLGSLILGWGLFNLIEGLIDHHVLRIHNVYQYTQNHLPWDLSFLLIGGFLFIIIGLLLIKSGDSDTFPRGGV